MVSAPRHQICAMAEVLLGTLSQGQNPVICVNLCTRGYMDGEYDHRYRSRLSRLEESSR
jgi:hypothetical protein